MSYAATAALQAGVYALLTADTRLEGVAVVDALPEGGISGTFVLIGPEEARDASDQTGQGAEHRLQLSVISSAAGFLQAKTVAALVSEILVDSKPPIARGRVVGIWFLKATAKRLDEGDVRRIDLIFRARVEL